MARIEKEQKVLEIREKLEKAKGIYLTDFTGLDVAEFNELRRKCREAGVEYRVVKNTLTRLAVRDAKLEILLDHITGPIALSLSYSDPIVPAKVLQDFAKERDLPKVKIGLVEGKLLSPDEVGRIAKLPPRDVLLSQFLSLLTSSIPALTWTLAGIIPGLVAVLESIAAAKADTGDDSGD